MINFTDVYKSYPQGILRKRHHALKGLSFRIEKGQTLGLIGVNGAGKSTCIRLMLDFIRPDHGQISILDTVPQDNRVRQRIGYLPEIPSFPSNLTIMDMLHFTGQACGLGKSEVRQRSEYWLERLGLWEHRKKPLRGYSKGMRQRASFCMALLNDAELFILDEPMSGLDPIGRAEILALILELKEKGKTILFCSHILEDIDKVVDQVLVLHHGETIFEGTPGRMCKETGARDLPQAFLALLGEREGVSSDKYKA